MAASDSPPQRAPRASTVAKREAILNAAAPVFAKRGVHAATTREIAEGADTLSGSLYYHFPSKEAIAMEVVSRYLLELLAAYEEVRAGVGTPVERLARLIEVSLEVSNGRLDEVVILYQDWAAVQAVDGSLDEMMEQVEAVWCSLLEEGMASGDVRSDIDPRVTYRTIMGAISWVPRWFRPSGRRTIQEIAALQAADLLHGVLVARPAARAMPAKKKPAAKKAPARKR